MSEDIPDTVQIGGLTTIPDQDKTPGDMRLAEAERARRKGWRKDGNKHGNRNPAGLLTVQMMNSYARKRLTQAQLEEILQDQDEPFQNRVAAQRLLRQLSNTTVADFEPYLDGECKLRELKAQGVDVGMVKSVQEETDAKGKTRRRIELHERQDKAFELVQNYTYGKPIDRQQIDVIHRLETTEDRENAAKSFRDRILQILQTKHPQNQQTKHVDAKVIDTSAKPHQNDSKVPQDDSEYVDIPPT